MLTPGRFPSGGLTSGTLPRTSSCGTSLFVFQNTRLFKTTLRENIMYGSPDASEEVVERALEATQCRQIIDRLPLGLETRIGVDGTYLSGGRTAAHRLGAGGSEGCVDSCPG